MPPAGEIVKPRRCGLTDLLLAKVSLYLEIIEAKTSFISNSAKAYPKQRRLPPPKGKYS